MFKMVLVTSSLLVGLQAYANCAGNFNQGVSELSFGVKYYEVGVASYNAAVDESEKPSPDFKVLCHHLVDSVGGFTVAKGSFLSCSRYFAAAEGSCSGPDQIRAREYKKICNSNSEVSINNQAAIRNALERTCFAGKDFEYYELESLVD